MFQIPFRKSDFSFCYRKYHSDIYSLTILEVVDDMQCSDVLDWLVSFWLHTQRKNLLYYIVISIAKCYVWWITIQLVIISQWMQFDVIWWPYHILSSPTSWRENVIAQLKVLATTTLHGTFKGIANRSDVTVNAHILCCTTVWLSLVVPFSECPINTTDENIHWFYISQIPIRTEFL